MYLCTKKRHSTYIVYTHHQISIFNVEIYIVYTTRSHLASRFARMLAAMLSDTPSPSCKRQRTCSSSPRAAEVDQQHQQQQQYLSGITACEDIEVSASVPTSLDSSSAAENTVAIEDARVEEFIEISSQEDVVCEDSGCYASRDGLPETSALVSTLLSVALKQWRGAMPEVPPPFYIFP